MDDIEVEPAELSPTQLEIERLALDQLRRADIETGDLTEIILNSMGLTRAPEGEFGDFDASGLSRKTAESLTSNEISRIRERLGWPPGDTFNREEIIGIKNQLVGAPTTEPGQIPTLTPENIAEIRQGLGFSDVGALSAPGTLRRLSDDEYISTLPEVQQQNYRNLSAQVERQRLALEGKLPVSEGLRQQKADEFRIFKEAQARLGNVITGEDPETAVAQTTAGIQSLNSFNDTFKLAEDAERRGEIQTGVANIRTNLGLVSDLAGREISRASAFPGRNLTALDPFAGQTGLLSRESLFSAQAQLSQQAGLGSIAGQLGGLVLEPLVTEAYKKIFT